MMFRNVLALLMCGSLVGCKVQEGEESQNIKDILLGKTTPIIQIVYCDATPSWQATGVQDGGWSEVADQAKSFWLQAPPGSRFEVYITGEKPGQPQSKMQYEIETNLRLKEKKAKAEKSSQDILQIGKQLREMSESNSKLPASRSKQLQYSPILEDTHFVMQRAVALGGQTAESKIIVFTDCQQFSKLLKTTTILKAKEENQAQILEQNLLKTIPPMKPAPKLLTLFYYPGNNGKESLTPAEEECLTNSPYARQLVPVQN